MKTLSSCSSNDWWLVEQFFFLDELDVLFNGSGSFIYIVHFITSKLNMLFLERQHKNTEELDISIILSEALTVIMRFSLKNMEFTPTFIPLLSIFSCLSNMQWMNEMREQQLTKKKELMASNRIWHHIWRKWIKHIFMQKQKLTASCLVRLFLSDSLDNLTMQRCGSDRFRVFSLLLLSFSSTK